MTRYLRMSCALVAFAGLLSAIACGGSNGTTDVPDGQVSDVPPVGDVLQPDAVDDTAQDMPTVDNVVQDTTGMDGTAQDSTGTDGTTPDSTGVDGTAPDSTAMDVSVDVAADIPVELPCIPECANAGDRQCAPGAQGFFQVCGTSDGCLKWGVAQDCGTGKACDGGSCLATCSSDPGCAQAGDKRCSSATAFQACAEVATGCFKFGEESPCLGAAVCVGDGSCECQHACAATGDRRCFAAEANLFQTCVEDPAGCRVWGEPTACEGSAVCKGTGVCEEVCVGDCPKAGDLQCGSGTTFQLCMTVQPGCLKWGAPEACPGALVCQAGKCQVECTSDAGCDAAGTPGCTAEGLARACEEVAPGCFKWGVSRSCPLHQACTGTACACEAPCVDGASACVADVDPHFRKACRADEAACTYWAYEDCGGGATCTDGACVPTCGSDPDCDEAGITRCESREAFATCVEVAGHPGCIQFGASAACPAHQECQVASGACACRVEAGCSAADARRCIDYDNAATCKADDKGCLYWSAPEPCPEGNTCSDGTCGPLCVSDLDCPAEGANRCTAEGLAQTCVEVPGTAGCIKWAPPQACPTHQVCSANGDCVCDNPCVSGQSRCIGLSQRQTCASQDLLGCTYWADAEACGEGDSCVKGECRMVVSPVVECGHVTFHLVNQGYSEVQLSGNFEGPTWVMQAATLVDGVWTASVDVQVAGRYEYKFIADGIWVRDPLNADSVGTPPMDNSVADVRFIRDCSTPDAGRCTASGTLETCQDNHGCAAWLPATDPCTSALQYCDGGACHAIVSPLVTDTSVTFTVRDQGFPVEVSGDFTSPAWGAYFPLETATGRRTATLLLADVPGLTAGRHLYKFHAPANSTWFFDPANPAMEDDGQGGFNSVLTIPEDCEPGCDTPGATRCVDSGTVETCGPDPDGCAAWLATPCGADRFCLRDACEPEPVIDPVAKTATFVVSDEQATSLKAVGDFTNPAWDLAVALVLVKTGPVWVGTTAALATGTYHYKLARNEGTGDTWYPDPNNPNQSDDGFGGKNSVFVIP